MDASSQYRLRAALGALLCAAAAACFALPAHAASTPLTTVKVTDCERGATAAERFAVFRAGMRQTGGSARLSLRFSLYESVAGGRYHAVKAPGLGVWRRSRTGVGGFAYRQKVRALADGSAYRVGVSYRWQDAAGATLKVAQRRSHPCRQSGPLPNLRVQRIGGKPVDGSPGSTRYAVYVINAGVAASTPTTVELAVDGMVQGRAALPALVPGQIRRVFVQGAGCTGGVSAEVDPDALVRETEEFDNLRSAACPAS
jgi:CARDB